MFNLLEEFPLLLAIALFEKSENQDSAESYEADYSILS
jgi:hypothetical protein